MLGSSDTATLQSPHLVYAGYEEINVFISPNSRRGICDPRTPDEVVKSYPALALKFENTFVAGERSGRTLKVIAKVTLESRSGATQRVMDYGVWLNASSRSMRIDSGQKRKLLVMLLEENRFLSFEDQREPGREGRKKGPHRVTGFLPYLESRPVDRLEFVSVTLIETRTEASVQYRFRVWWDEGKFCVLQTSFQNQMALTQNPKTVPTELGVIVSG